MVLPLLTRIDHVGIACRDLDRAIELYQATFGLEVVSLEVNQEQGVREAMLAVGPGAGLSWLALLRLALLWLALSWLALSWLALSWLALPWLASGRATSSCSSRWPRTRRWASSSTAAARGSTTSDTASATSARPWP